MEVFGRRDFSNKKTAKNGIFCQSCQDDHKTVNAEGYCETCNEYICSSCITAHRQLTVTKNHVIKSKDEMPTVLNQSAPCNELCVDHKSEIVKFYCQVHDCVGCGDCMVLEHKSCKVQLVSDVSSNYGNSDALIRIKHGIYHLNQNIASCKNEIEQSLKEAEKMKAEVVAEINAFRNDLNKYLDQVEADVIKEIQQLNAMDVSQQRKLLDQCQSLEAELKAFRNKLDQNSANVNQLFVTSKLAQKMLQKCHEINQDIASRSQIHKNKFEPSKDLMALQIKHSPLGNISSELKKFTGPSTKSIIGMKSHFVEKMNVQAANEDICFFPGMAMIARDEILLADSENCSLKIINAVKGKITSMYKLLCSPWDVAIINSETAATTLPFNGKILFLNTKNGLSESHYLEVRVGCRGIDHHNGIMAVSFRRPPSVQIMDVKGHILHEVSDTSIFRLPHCIALSNDNKSVFVSDSQKDVIYELSIDGRLKATIKNEEIKYPAGLTVTSDGIVVVCGAGNSDRVSMIVPGTREIVPLCLQNVQAPRSILVSEDQKKLYICEIKSSKDCNYIKTFELK